MATKSIRLIPGWFFIIKEYEPAQRVLLNKEWWPFIWIVRSHRFIQRIVPMGLVTLNVKYMQTRSFHSVKAFGRIAYFRKWGG